MNITDEQRAAWALLNNNPSTGLAERQALAVISGLLPVELTKTI